LYYIFYTNADSLTSTDGKDRQNESSRLLHDYFQLSIQVNELFEKWALCDKRFQRGQIPIGIRVLAQEPLENLISFICSSNNNVQRITKMVRSISDEYGRKLGTMNEITYHQFPTIGTGLTDRRSVS
jgi:N-glycosylase/DNA lyase